MLNLFKVRNEVEEWFHWLHFGVISLTSLHLTSSHHWLLWIYLTYQCTVLWLTCLLACWIPRIDKWLVFERSLTEVQKWTWLQLREKQVQCKNYYLQPQWHNYYNIKVIVIVHINLLCFIFYFLILILLCDQNSRGATKHLYMQ